MPGIVTHHAFGIDVHESLAEVIGDSSAALDAFLLGNQGPDPFFYLMGTPTTRELRRIGQTMHKRKTPELLASVHDCFVVGSSCSKGARGTDAPIGDRDDSAPAPSVRPSEPCRAYALGFLCHYLLDSTVHPLVYAQQHAICDTQVEGLTDEWSHRVVHATIETALDEYVLTTRLDATAATLPPHKTMLRCPAPTLADVSRRYSPVLRDTYGLNAPETAFSTAVNLNRIAQQALDSKSGGIRQRFDYLAGAGMPSAYVLALSHCAEPRPYTLFANDEHITWENPFADGEFVCESFDELYARARARAIEILPAYAGATFDLKACEKLVGNVNFLGRTITPE